MAVTEDIQQIQTTGILHFTISVRDHAKSAEFYADTLGCVIERVTDHFAFMKTGSDYFVLYKNPDHVAPNGPGGTRFHHAFIVDGDAFDQASAALTARGYTNLLPDTKKHKSFPGRHFYFHDLDGNGIEITDVTG
jgi:catechol 2,3-dioxygenase-like lactoylglutathione lyase family enzyme